MSEYLEWSEDIKFPETCDFCIEGCQCDSPFGLSVDDMDYPEQTGECEYCQYGCQCGADDWEPKKGETEDAALDCSCECECCTCSCNCENLLIDAASYNNWIKKTCYACDSRCLTEESLNSNPLESRCLQQIGDFQLYVRTLPMRRFVSLGLFGIGGKQQEVRTSLDIFEGEKRNKVFFSGPVHIPIIAKNSQVWMSLTPNEIFTQREALSLAKGSVLIAGLGMGWLTQRILESPEVSSVTQVEIEPEILNIFGKPLKEMFSDKISLINDNIWNYIENINLEIFDTILFDIWPQYWEAQWDKKFIKLQNEHPNVWGWGAE